jgi:hypothetical protein
VKTRRAIDKAADCHWPFQSPTRGSEASTSTSRNDFGKDSSQRGICVEAEPIQKKTTARRSTAIRGALRPGGHSRRLTIRTVTSNALGSAEAWHWIVKAAAKRQ